MIVQSRPDLKGLTFADLKSEFGINDSDVHTQNLLMGSHNSSPTAGSEKITKTEDDSYSPGNNITKKVKIEDTFNNSHFQMIINKPIINLPQ